VRAEADDLFQDTLLRVHRARASFIPGAPAVHWIFAIARSAYIDRLRHRGRRPEAALDHDEHAGAGPETSPEGLASARAGVRIVDAELARMSEANRSAYVLVREEELRAAAAAQILGTSTDAVKQRAHRAHEQLRDALRRAGWGEGAT
jgi:RNA polymerase sigma-70 factor (ECF subfamily)